MNTIGIDLRLISEGHTGGMTQLIQGVLRALFEVAPQRHFVVFGTVFNRSLLNPLPENVELVTLPIDTFAERMHRRATEDNFLALIRSYPFKPVATPSILFPFRRQIVIIPDIQHEHHPEFFTEQALSYRREAFNEALTMAGAIGTISEFAHRTLMERPNCLCRDIFLMPPALQTSHRSAPETLTADELAIVPTGDYFLMPANLWKHKNHRRTLEAFRRFHERTGRKVEFLFTGHPEGWKEIAAEFTSLPIRHLGFVRPVLLRRLLENARALVYFSLYEGFGMPLLEAFDARTPVLCSNTTSLPEVGGDAVLACDPTDVESMSRLMERILAESELRPLLVERGQQRIQAYSWESSARNLLAAIDRIIRPPSARVPRIEVGAEAPLVSIVTPSFNQGRFLRRTIDSVLGQSYPRIEYLVMDGGSTDESVAILKSYGDRFPWVSEKDRGQTDAINKGFARSHGSIRAYLNSDDMLHPRAIENVVRHFEQNAACDMVYGEADYIDTEDRFLGGYRSAPYTFERLMQDCCVCQPAAFWRTQIAEKIGPFDVNLQFAMDYDYWIRIACAGGEIQYIPDLLAYSRLYPETKTRSSRREIYGEIFHICRRSTGTISRDYVEGYWHHLVWEAETGWPRQLQRSPRMRRLMEALHWTYLNQGARATIEAVLKKTVRATRRRAATGVRGLSKSLTLPARKVLGVIRRTKVATKLTCFPESNPSERRGLFTDNWLSSRCWVSLRQRAPGSVIRLAGIPVKDMQLTVTLNGDVISRHQLVKDTPTTLHLPLPCGVDGRVELDFSDWIPHADGRKLSFLVEETNLFAEQDLV